MYGGVYLVAFAAGSSTYLIVAAAGGLVSYRTARARLSCVGVPGLEPFFFSADFNGTALMFGSLAGISSIRFVSMLGFGWDIGYM